MHPRTPSWSVLLAAAPLLLATACSGSGESGPPRPRNVLLIVLDTLRPDHLGCYGYERATSPNLDAFADESFVFLDAQSAAPWTAPALHSLLTSLHPGVHGILEHPNPGRMGDAVTTLAEVLQERGFATAAFTEGGYARARFGLDQGFDHFPPNEAYERFLSGRELQPERLANQVERALAWVEEQPDAPFFLFFHTYRPHVPWDPPEERIRRFRPGYDEAAEHAALARAVAAWETEGELSAADWELVTNHLYHCNLTAVPLPADRERFLREVQVNTRPAVGSGDEGGDYTASAIRFATDLYDAAILHTDAEIAGLWDGLDRLGRLDETLIAVVSDHGEGLGQHRRMQHGKVLHDEALRIVLLLRFPRPDPDLGPPWRVPELVRSVDVMPTLLDALGHLPRDLVLQGESLLPLLAGRDEPRVALSQGLNKHGEERRWYSLCTERWRFVYDGERDHGRLFDRHADPLEERDVAADHPDVARELRAELVRRLELDASLGAAVAGDVVREELDEETLGELRDLGYVR